MFAFASITLFFAGVLLIVVVLVRKMPALVQLPEESSKPITPQFIYKIRQRIESIDWQRWQKLAFTVLVALVESLRRLVMRLSLKSEQLARALRARLRILSGEESSLSKKKFSFSSRIRRRSAFVEEERRLIEQLTSNPQDTEAYRRLGNLYAIAGNEADARAAFSEVLRLSPNDAEARRRLVELGGVTNGGS